MKPKEINQDKEGFWLYGYIGVFLDEDGKWKNNGIFRDRRPPASKKLFIIKSSPIELNNKS